MKIIKTADYNEMSKKAANIIAAQMILKPNSVLGLATGSSPIGTYKELIKKYEVQPSSLPFYQRFPWYHLVQRR